MKNETLVRCMDCEFCHEMKSRVDGQKFFYCFPDYRKLPDHNSPEYWSLLEKNISVPKKMIKVDPSTHRRCDEFVMKKEEGET